MASSLSLPVDWHNDILRSERKEFPSHTMVHRIPLGHLLRCPEELCQNLLELIPQLQMVLQSPFLKYLSHSDHSHESP